MYVGRVVFSAVSFPVSKLQPKNPVGVRKTTVCGCTPYPKGTLALQAFRSGNQPQTDVTMSIVAVQIPFGCPPGGQFMVMAPNGVQMLCVNPGLPPGAVIHVRAPAPQPMVAPVPQSMGTAPEPPPLKREPTKAEVIKEEDIPPDAVVTKAKAIATSLPEAPKQEDLCPCLSTCCVAFSLYPVYPDCLGIYCKGVACACLELEILGCKVSKSEGVLCKVCAGEINLLNPIGCCKLASQCCCIDARFAVPTDEEVPCQLACAGLVCVKSFKCICKFYETRPGQQSETV